MKTIEEQRERNKEKMRKWRETHGEESRAYSREYYATHKQQVKEKQRIWGLKNPETRRECQRAWVIKHREHKREYERQYYLVHKEEMLARMRDHQRSTCLGIATGVKLRRLNKRPYTGYCEVCQIEKPKYLQYHHLKADPNTGLWLCAVCHRMAECIDKGFDEVYKHLKDGLQEKLNQLRKQIAERR